MILTDLWKKIAMRLQSAARQSDTLSVIRITVVTNSSGVPLFWTPPKVVGLEPKKNLSLEMLRKDLTEEELQQILNLIVS